MQSRAKINMRYYVCIVDVCNRVRMFDMSTLELVGQMVLPKARHFTPTIAVHGSVLAAAIGERVYVFDVHIGRLTARKVTLHLLFGRCSLVFSPDGRTLVASCRYYPGCSLATTREFVVADGSEKAVSSMRLPFQRTSGAFRLHWGGHGRALVSSFQGGQRGESRHARCHRPTVFQEELVEGSGTHSRGGVLGHGWPVPVIVLDAP